MVRRTSEQGLVNDGVGVREKLCCRVMVWSHLPFQIQKVWLDWVDEGWYSLLAARTA
jgi:DNA-directed RNA polymerase subunit N (RpoN/RPB10)